MIQTRRSPRVALSILLWAGAGWLHPDPLVAAPQAPTGEASSQSVRFADATAWAGLEFQHVHGGSGKKYLVETMGSGLALVDLDADGWVDAYLVQQGTTPETAGQGPFVNQLFRNRGDGTLEEATRASRTGDSGYGMGVAAGDYDNDGFIDLYLANFGPNVLLRNNGDGTFGPQDGAGVDDDLWGVSAAWGDLDSDGDLDLYVVNYVDFGWDNNPPCGDARRRLLAYCHPEVFNAQPDRLYENRGDGTFEEIGARAGVDNTVDGKGLGVVWGDYDNDGDPDIYVANDSTRNFLYTNQGDGTFVDDSFLAGVGYGKFGETQSGMGTDWGDPDGDGKLDIIVTNLGLETNTLYHNLGFGSFVDESIESGIGEPSLFQVGFGANWMDVDNDGDPDLFIANGHILDNIVQLQQGGSEAEPGRQRYAQPNHLYLNSGRGQFDEVHERAGDGMALVKVSRGSAVADLDNDGDLDVMVSNSNQRADYLRNESETGNWIQLLLVGRTANRTAAGTRVEITPVLGPPAAGGDRPPAPRIQEVTAGSSYGSTSDARVHAGLGSATSAQVTVLWPGGVREELGELGANRLHLIRQGHGSVASRGALIPPTQVAPRRARAARGLGPVPAPGGSLRAGRHAPFAPRAPDPSPAPGRR